jgi:hypothetical protein
MELQAACCHGSKTFCLTGRKLLRLVLSALTRKILSGIVQGSCLGPLLFLMYVNDVTDILPSHRTCKLFADGLKLYSVT